MFVKENLNNKYNCDKKSKLLDYWLKNDSNEMFSLPTKPNNTIIYTKIDTKTTTMKHK